MNRQLHLSTVALRAAVLSCGVSLAELVLHGSKGAAIGSSLPHLALDASLIFPLAAIALVGAHLVQGSLHRLRPSRLGESFIYGVVAALVLGALMLPSVGMHGTAHSLIEGSAPGSHRSMGRFEGSLAIDVQHGLEDVLPIIPFAIGIAMGSYLMASRLPRRRWRVAAVLATALIVPPGAQATNHVITPFAATMPVPPTITSADLTLTAAQTGVQVLPGAPTNMWTFNGSFPGPTIRRPSGQQTRVTVVNQLPTSVGEITLHHHGNHSTSADDGQPHTNLISTGSSRTYTYDFMENGAPERGAIQWYHDHRMDVTGRNVWMGLAGMVVLEDPAEAAIDAALPRGQFDVPLMVADRRFDGANQIPYTFDASGVNGDVTTVNGAPIPHFDVARRRYRFRLLNASNNRSYDFGFADGRPFIQVGAESGLLPAPVARTRMLMGPGERADVVVDFSDIAIGGSVELRNLAGLNQMNKVMRFNVTSDAIDDSTIPSVLRSQPALDPLEASTDRLWTVGRDIDSGMWTINGQGFDHDRIDAAPKLGTVERWTFVNTTSVDHIVHIHDVDWKVTLRSGGLPPNPGALADESGMKESFRIRPNETVTVAARFTDHLGKYVLHCHMLEHEDFAMMAQFEVVP